MAVATAAIICVLSVFNGFHNILAERLDTLSPDILVQPHTGKVFAEADSIAAKIARIENVDIVAPVLIDNALCVNEGIKLPVLLKGVDKELYSKVTSIDSLIFNRLKPRQRILEPKTAILSIGASMKTGATVGTQMMIFAPRRIGRVNLANPAASFLTDSITSAAIFRSNQNEFDENMIITDLATVRDLLQYDSEASAIEIKTRPGSNIDAVVESVKRALGPDFIVKNRMQQQEMNFRMVSIEKWITFLLLFFILIIASFNTISSLSMLVLDKQKSMSVLKAMGFTSKRIGAIFGWESIYVALIGGISGIIIGVALAWAQQQFGFIKIQGDPASLTTVAYPVSVEPTDILVTLLPIVGIGIMTALITAAFARGKAKNALN